MSRLKTSWIVMANIALMSAILIFVALYSNYERKENYRSQVEHFVNASIAMERVTGNYLEGEQQICDNWAQYINSRDLTLEEAGKTLLLSARAPQPFRWETGPASGPPEADWNSPNKGFSQLLLFVTAPETGEVEIAVTFKLNGNK